MAIKATSDNPADTTDQVDQQTLTVEQVNQIVNSAISSRLKSFEKKFDEFATKLTTKPESTEPILQQKEEKVSNAELLNLKKQFEALKVEKEQETAKRKDLDLRTTVKEHLQKAGVPAHLMKAATAVVIDSDKLVSYNEDDQLVFRSDVGDLDLASGLKQWSKSSDGKVFLAPKNVSGSGEKVSNNQSGSQTKSKSLVPNRQDALASLEAALSEGKFFNQE